MYGRREGLWEVVLCNTGYGGTPITVWADNEQDALDEAADWAETHAPGLRVFEESLPDYGPDEDGICRLGNHGLPYDSQGLRARRIDREMVHIGAPHGPESLRPVGGTHAEYFLQWALEQEHSGDCGNACDIHAAVEAECYRWAGHLLSGAGEFPLTSTALEWLAEEDEAEHAAGTGESHKVRLDQEREALLEEPHVTCPSCNAVLWYVGYSDPQLPDSCANCAKEVPAPVEVEE